MLTRGSRFVVRGKIIEKLDVRSQRRSRENSLEEIVAEQSVFGHLAGQRGLKGVNIVNSLAGVGTFSKQILVDV